MAERHVSEAATRIARQRAVLTRLDANGLPLERAEELLAELQRTHAVQQEHLAAIRAEQRLGLRDGDGVLISSQPTMIEQLAELHTQLAGSSAWAERLHRLTQVTRRILHADGASVAVREDGLCHYVDEDAIGPLWRGRLFPLKDCVSGWVMLNAAPAAIDDIWRDERVPAEAYRATFVRSVLLVPVGSGQPVAALGAYWSCVHQPTDDETLLLGRIARVLSGVLA